MQDTADEYRGVESIEEQCRGMRTVLHHHSLKRLKPSRKNENRADQMLYTSMREGREGRREREAGRDGKAGRGVGRGDGREKGRERRREDY